MKQMIIGIVLTLFTFINCSTTEAAGNGWTVKLYGGLLDSSAMMEGDGDAAFLRAEAKGSAAFSIGLEYRLAERFGIELSTLFSNIDIDFSAQLGNWTTAKSIQLEMMPLTLGFNLHLTPGSRFDFYVASSISYVRYGDIEYNIEELEIDERITIGSDSPAFGLALGIDMPFGSSGWSFAAQAQKMWTDAEDIAIDPVMILVGFGYHF